MNETINMDELLDWVLGYKEWLEKVIEEAKQNRHRDIKCHYIGMYDALCSVEMFVQDKRDGTNNVPDKRKSK